MTGPVFPLKLELLDDLGMWLSERLNKEVLTRGLLLGVNDLDLSRFALGGFTGSKPAENSFDFGLSLIETFFLIPDVVVVVVVVVCGSLPR